MTGETEQASTGDIRAVAKVGAICALFGPGVRELSAADVAERTGLNRTTAYRYCASMVAAGLLEKGSRRGTFALGALLVEIGAQALRQQPVVEIARPHLRTLSAALRRTAVLSVPGRTGPVVALVEEDSSRVVVVTVRPGTRLDWSTAQAQVLMAYGDTASTAALAADLGPHDRAQLDLAVHAVRRQGHAVAHHAGSVVVAAPVFDETSLCATLAALGTADDDLDETVRAVVDAAAALSEHLGATRRR